MKIVKPSRKKSLLTGFVALIILAGGLAISWATATNKGIVINATATNPSHAPAIAMLDGTYISLKYKDIYKIKVQAPSPADLESYYLTANSNYEKHLAVIVHSLDTSGIRGFTGFTSRDSQPDLYDKKSITVASEPATEFIKKDLTERTIFISRANRVAVLSFVSTSQYDDLEGEITAIVNSFSWKQ